MNKTALINGLAINFEEILTEICCDSDGNKAIKLVVLKWQSCQQIVFLQCVVACPFGTLFQHLTEKIRDKKYL
jgi:hypothetical protein